MAVTVWSVEADSPAARKGILAGDRLIGINGHAIEDVLDYRFYAQEGRLKLLLERGGKPFRLHIRKDEMEELGLRFETYLMDKQRRCRNKCVFCFIDQMPKGLRESLYFKDDDSRLSFLFGNYITLTNLTEHEVERILKLHISPVNVSVHTTNPELRARMMGNPYAGDSLGLLRRFARGNIALNVQLVLCPGLNDGAELERSMRDLSELLPAIESVAAVPVGLTSHREGLYPLLLFTQEEAAAVIDQMERMGEQLLQNHGRRLFYPSDEFYLLAKRPLPPAGFYGDFLQLENGVGMAALLREQFIEALADTGETPSGQPLTIATGALAAPLLDELMTLARQKWPSLDVTVVPIINRFFGESITVAGLVSGADLIGQLRTLRHGRVLIPASMLRREGDLFLDNISIDDATRELGTEVRPVGPDGADLVAALLK